MRFNYEQAIEITEQALDLLDVKKFLVKNKYLPDIMDDIENYIADCDYEDAQEAEAFMKQHPDIFGEYPDLFNYMGEDEFLDYCQEIYPEKHWGYECIERYWVSN